MNQELILQLDQPLKEFVDDSWVALGVWGNCSHHLGWLVFALDSVKNLKSLVIFVELSWGRCTFSACAACTFSCAAPCALLFNSCESLLVLHVLLACSSCHLPCDSSGARKASWIGQTCDTWTSPDDVCVLVLETKYLHTQGGRHIVWVFGPDKITWTIRNLYRLPVLTSVKSQGSSKAPQETVFSKEAVSVSFHLCKCQ